MKKILKEVTYILIGTYLISLSINLFLLPNKITIGGVSGIGTITYYLFNLDIGLMTIILNIPLFIYAIYAKGLKFCFKSIITTIILSIFLNIFKYETLIINNKLDLIISSIYGGIALGVGLSLIFKVDATSGGSDLLANILKDKINLSVSKILFFIDLIIVLALIIVFKDINIGLYSIIAIYISAKLIDFTFEGINRFKIINIITNNDNIISKNIIEEINRSATIDIVKGAYTNNEYTKVTCLVALNEINKVKNIVKKYDDNSIIYISNAYEVIGNGFKKFRGG